jgi:hypothetical protein
VVCRASGNSDWDGAVMVVDFLLCLAVLLVAASCLAYRDSRPGAKIGRYDFNQAYWTPQKRGDDDGVD